MAGSPETPARISEPLLPQEERLSIQGNIDAFDLLVFQAVMTAIQRAIDLTRQGQRIEARFARSQAGELLIRASVIDEQVAAIEGIIFPLQDIVPPSFPVGAVVLEPVRVSQPSPSLPIAPTEPPAAANSSVLEQKIAAARVHKGASRDIIERIIEYQQGQGYIEEETLKNLLKELGIASLPSQWRANVNRVLGKHGVRLDKDTEADKTRPVYRLRIIEGSESSTVKVPEPTDGVLPVAASTEPELEEQSPNVRIRSILKEAQEREKPHFGVKALAVLLVILDAQEKGNPVSKKELGNAYHILNWVVAQRKLENLGLRMVNILAREVGYGRSMGSQYILELIPQEEEGRSDKEAKKGKDVAGVAESDKAEPVPVFLPPAPFEAGQPEPARERTGRVSIIPAADGSGRKILVGDKEIHLPAIAAYERILTVVGNARGRIVNIDEILPPSAYGTREARLATVEKAVLHINHQIGAEYLVWESRGVKAILEALPPAEANGLSGNSRQDVGQYPEQDGEQQDLEKLIDLKQRLLLSSILVNPSASRILRVLGLPRIEGEERNRLQGIYNTYKFLVEIKNLEPEDVDALRKGLVIFIQNPASITSVKDPDLKTLLYCVQGLKEKDIDRLFAEIPQGVQGILNTKREQVRQTGVLTLHSRRTR